MLVQATSLDRSEVGQPSENEEVRQADILIACLDREVRCFKKWKKRHLLPSGEVVHLLQEAMGEQVLREMQCAEGSCIHLTLSLAAQEVQEVVLEDYVAITAHWGRGGLSEGDTVL